MGSLQMSPTCPTINSNDTTKTFEGAFNQILNDISFILKDQHQSTLKAWIKCVLEYNVPNGKKIRGKLVETAYKILSGETKGKNVEKAQVLGWCIEILQAAFLIVDDLMDNGTTRRGKLCWYKVNNMGTIATNDALILESLVYQIVKRHFGSSKLYVDLLDVILGVTFNTTLGQSLDIRCSASMDNIEYLNRPSMQLYQSIATLKTSYYTIYLPIALAMVLANDGIRNNYNDKNLWNEFLDIALKIGMLFQIQDDYFDCFADKKKTGKEGSDIQEGKCSWLYARAMELADQKQRNILRENNGKNGTEEVSSIKKLYLELDLPNEFLMVQQTMTADILESIEKLSHPRLEIVLKQTFEQIIKRVC